MPLKMAQRRYHAMALVAELQRWVGDDFEEKAAILNEAWRTLYWQHGHNSVWRGPEPDAEDQPAPVLRVV